MVVLNYKNRRNEVKQCVVTDHALKRFKYRYEALLNHYRNGNRFTYSKVLFKKDLLDLFYKDHEQLLVWFFNRPESKRITLDNLGGKEFKKMRSRNKKYGGYLRLRVWLWDFIIENNALKTVEINDRELRHLNDYILPKNIAVDIDNPVLRRFSTLDEKRRTHVWIESEIKYEGRPGIHSYHMCECNRGGCRSRYCVKCWEEMLEIIK